MKKSILACILTVTITTIGYAGSKDFSPVNAPIEPVPAMNTPVPVYIGLGLLWGKYNNCVKGCTYEDVTFGALLRAGYEWNQYIGVEARMLATFLGNDSEGGETLRHIGLFAKPMYPLTEDFNIYGLLGYGWTKTYTGGNKRLSTVDDSGFSGGIGLEYDLSSKEDDRDEDTMYKRGFDGQADQEKGWGLFLDYQRLLIKSDTPDMDVVTGGVTYDF